MTLFCVYEERVFPTPERWSGFGPRAEAKLIRRRLRARRFERWDYTGTGPSLEALVDDFVDEADFDFVEWDGAWPEEWQIGTNAPSPPVSAADGTTSE